MATAKVDEHSVLKARRDLVWHPQAAGWSVYDPLARCGFRCGQAERWLFEQFDGRSDLAAIHWSASVHDSINVIAWHEVVALAETLMQRSLVRRVAQNPSPQESLPGPARSWLQWFSQSVSWRLRGVNPQPFLRWLAPRSNLFFSPLAVRLWLGLMALVTLLVLADFQRLTDQANLWQWMIQPASGSTLFAIFVATRAVHELGHALVLTRFGGRTPDIGVIFMLGAPCVYCDVTESCRLPHAWQRAAVAAGGMYAESIVAVIAACVWLATLDGQVNTLALQTMFVCSISTWLVNANPLMRFDGYYLLSDWCDEPNLRARADQCALRLLKRLALGKAKDSPVPIEPRRFWWLSLFSILGFLYRISMSWMMASVIVAMYTLWNFEEIGKWLAIALLACWWGVPVMKLMKLLIRSATTVWSKARLSLLSAWVLLMIALVPLPGRQRGQGWVQPAQMQGLYAPQSSRLKRIIHYPGQRVEQGATIFQLDDDAAELRRIDLSRHALRSQVQYTSLVEQSKRKAPIDIDLNTAEKSAQALAQQAGHAQQEVDKLNVQAELTGQLISLPAQKLTDIDGHFVDPAPSVWLDADQCGRVIAQGTMVAAICSRQQLAIVPLDDRQLNEVSQGTRVRLYLPSHSHRVWEATVQAIVRLEQLDSLDRLASASAAQADSSGKQPSTSPSDRAGYAAVIELPMQDANIGAEVQAVFTVRSKTLATLGNDWAHSNLRWLMPSGMK